MESYKIKPLVYPYIEPVQVFLSEQLNGFFGYKYSLNDIKEDLFSLESKYIIPDKNNLWIALDSYDNIIGTIAVSGYDDRINILKGRYDTDKTSEICRCYVHPEYRRKGIGCKLLMVAEKFIIEKGFYFIYLHTHHFLPGGYDFWKKNKYIKTLEIDDDQQIIHMEKIYRLTTGY